MTINDLQSAWELPPEPPADPALEAALHAYLAATYEHQGLTPALASRCAVEDVAEGGVYVIREALRAALDAARIEGNMR